MPGRSCYKKPTPFVISHDHSGLGLPTQTLRSLDKNRNGQIGTVCAHAKDSLLNVYSTKEIKTSILVSGKYFTMGCACACECACACACMHMGWSVIEGAHVCRGCQSQVVFLTQLPPYFLKHVLSLNLGLTNFTKEDGPWVPGFLHFPVIEIVCTHCHTWIASHEFWGTELGFSGLYNNHFTHWAMYSALSLW